MITGAKSEWVNRFPEYSALELRKKRISSYEIIAVFDSSLLTQRNLIKGTGCEGPTPRD